MIAETTSSILRRYNENVESFLSKIETLKKNPQRIEFKLNSPL